MYVRNKIIKRMTDSKEIRENRHNDIVECASRGDFEGVARELSIDPYRINTQKTGTGVTALMVSAGSNQKEMVAYLLQQEHINLSIKDDFGRNALDHARMFPGIVGALMKAMYPQHARRGTDFEPR